MVDWKKYVDNGNDPGDIDELEETTERKKKKKKFAYDPNTPHINLKPGENEVDNTKTIDFETFVQITTTGEFIKLFKKSLMISYNEKIVIYNNHLKKTKSNQTTKTSMFDHDSNQDRNEKQIKEIEKILNTLKLRMKNITEEKIRSDFKDIINNEINGFASLVGRGDVKNMLAQRIYTFAKNPLVFIKGFQNMAIYGKSGVGKTKLAETIGYIYAKTGILVRRKFRKVSKTDFTSSFVDESSSLTRGVVLSCLEGVLFVDEAYGLTPQKTLWGGNNHKDEAITELVNILDTYKGLGIVMVGGYEDLMEKQFMTSNEGMKRRFPTVIRLKDYNSENLTDMLIDFIRDSSPEMEINQEDANYIFSVVDTLNEKHIFDRQAGDMQNMAGEITNALYGSLFTWGSSSEDNKHIINSGVGEFLKNKGIKMTIS